jgi:pyruvate dehydrogenase E2 component (dihydrolipoamide acetyltransferase)
VERFAAAAPRPLPAQAEGREIDLQGLRKLTAERMAYSFSTAPHFCLSMEVDAGELSVLRERLQRTAGKKPGLEITYTDLLVRSAAIALREHPAVNACWTGSAVREWRRVNIGIAVAVEDGLTVPVIRDADRLSLAGIARQRARLVELARAGRLALADLEGGTFTISNLGMFGIDFFQAIINPPQAAILAVGRIKERPAVHEGQVKPRPIMYLSLAGDHRVLDGAAGARFLARLAGLIEDPMELLLSEGSSEA